MTHSCSGFQTERVPRMRCKRPLSWSLKVLLLFSLFTSAAILAACYAKVQVPYNNGPGVTLTKNLLKCDLQKNPSCPDYSAISYQAFGGTHMPTMMGEHGIQYLNEGYSAPLGRQVAVFIFKPSQSRSKPSKVEAQALTILRSLQTSLNSSTDLVIGKTYWQNGRVMFIDGYIFLKTSHGWQRKADANLINQVIRAGL